MAQILTIQTSGPGLYEFTDHLLPLAQGDGVMTLMVRHTSCSLLIQENADPDVQVDLKAFFERLVPPSDHPSMSYLVHTYEGPDDMPAHIKASPALKFLRERRVLRHCDPVCGYLLIEGASRWYLLGYRACSVEECVRLLHSYSLLAKR